MAELKDRLLRAMAEAENVRRRASRDREDTARYAITNFAREVLSVADNLERALSHIDAEARASNEAIETLAAGVEMTEREMLGILERFGVKPIEALGHRFDHNLHEAMFEIEDAEKPVGTVVHELRRGYILQDRLLRPSQVGVSKGGPTGDEAAGEQEEDSDSNPCEAAKTDPQSAYERQADARSDGASAKGSKLDREL
jgi:molecular chaperone GrpE